MQRYRLYKNVLTGEIITKLNHARAFVYFYAKADKDNKPQGKDIIELKRNEKDSNNINITHSRFMRQ